MRIERLSPALLACAALLLVGCNRTQQTDTSSDARMDADTVARSADSLMIGASGALAIPPEPPAASGGQTQSGALSDEPGTVRVEQPSSSTPRAIPAEMGSGASSTSRRFP